MTKLYNEELRVVAGSAINDIKELDGKPVNFGEAGSSADVSGRLIFEILGIRPTPVNMNQADALLAVKSGKVAATLMLDGKPLSILGSLKDSDGLKLLPVPYTQPLEDDYLPAEITNDEPQLNSGGTIAGDGGRGRGAGGVQLAEEHRSPSTGGAAGECPVQPARRIPEDAAASEMERSQPGGAVARLEAVPCGG